MPGVTVVAVYGGAPIGTPTKKKHKRKTKGSS